MASEHLCSYGMLLMEQSVYEYTSRTIKLSKPLQERKRISRREGLGVSVDL
jgi:hypothetical protein